MLVTNSPIKFSNEECNGKKVSLMGRIARTLGNGINQIIDAEIENANSKTRHVELAMCVRKAMKEGFTDRPAA